MTDSISAEKRRAARLKLNPRGQHKNTVQVVITPKMTEAQRQNFELHVRRQEQKR